ncbi:TPA: hypothetical protein ACH3X3_005255 [Trebouxia sp. C0006]
MDNVKAYCDTAIQIAKNSILETVQAELQAAASNTNALITQRTDPIQQRLNSVEAAVEHSERMRRSTSMIVKGFTPASTFTHRQTTASVHQLLAQHATNQQFSITSVTVFGNPADGPKPIQVREDLPGYLTPVQLQERQQLSHTHTQLRQRQLRPFWRGSVLLCTEEDGELKKYKPGEVVNGPAAPQRPYPRRLNSRVRRPPAAAPNPTTGLAAASAAAAAAIAPRPAPTHSAAPQVTTDPSTAAPTEPALLPSAPAEPAMPAPASSGPSSEPIAVNPTAAPTAADDAATIAGVAATAAAAAAAAALPVTHSSSIPTTSGSTAAPLSATLPPNSQPSTSQSIPDSTPTHASRAIGFLANAASNIISVSPPPAALLSGFAQDTSSHLPPPQPPQPPSNQ